MYAWYLVALATDGIPGPPPLLMFGRTRDGPGYPARRRSSLLLASLAACAERCQHALSTRRSGEYVVDSQPADLGLTHVALPVRDVDASIAFYAKYAHMHVIHRRDAHGDDVAWITDATRPFVVVLIRPHTVDGAARLGGWAHLGVACGTRQEVDERCRDARAAGYDVTGPEDSGPPVGYWAFITDADGHNLELSHGQDVAATVERLS